MVGRRFPRRPKKRPRIIQKNWMEHVKKKGENKPNSKRKRREHSVCVCEHLKAKLYEFYKFNRESGGEVEYIMPRLHFLCKGRCGVNGCYGGD
ncbi:unnamed protein product [Eruca vesicaria subsp. sativa]|uniref:Uncharacterized protein n=1 Tax=Eruca vesicaria subsp. sativa TaxID=29727 RepID=A0ABC8KW55_ERUVS|nr:unnamed protein product [Eruca vesicaria subsp. sativa]